MADSPSSQYSIDGLGDLVANLPDSDEVLKEPPSDEDFFDIDILIRKLEAYKASVEDVQAQIRRKRSINPREVSEVTAAARLKLRLDGRPAASSESHDNSVLSSPVAPAFSSRAHGNSNVSSPIAVAFPSSARDKSSLSSPVVTSFPSSASSSNASSSSEISYFDPITPEEREIPSLPLASKANRDTWKSSHSVSIPIDIAKPSDILNKPTVPPRSPGTLVPTKQPSKPPAIKLLGSKSTVSSPLASPAFTASEWLGVPRPIISVTTSESGEGRKSIDQLSMCPPDEDRIRREIETYTIKDWVTKDVKQLELIALAKEAGQVQTVAVDGDEEDLQQRQTRAPNKTLPTPAYEYGKITFRERVGSLWHRRTKTDRIIDLYYDMEAAPKQKMGRARTTRKEVSGSEDRNVVAV